MAHDHRLEAVSREGAPSTRDRAMPSVSKAPPVPVRRPHWMIPVAVVLAAASVLLAVLV